MNRYTTLCTTASYDGKVTRADFSVYEIVGKFDDGTLIYKGENGDVDDVAHAQVIIEATIRWDGCSNWNFHTDRTLMHFCSSTQAREFGELINGLYEQAKTLLTNYEE